MPPFFTIAYPAIDPVIFQFGMFAIRWYSLSYVVGILLGWWYLKHLNRKYPPALSEKALDDIMLWVILGVVLGGRLGYVLFYNSSYYLSEPAEILRLWKGGMSFHGGMLGVIVAIYLCCRYHKIYFWPVIDLVACVTPIGIGLGRIANFINGELYGRITDVPWAMIFPGDPFPRHPSQLYEAFLEGFVLFLIMWFFVYHTKAREYPRVLSGVFLTGYGIFRAFVEYFREPDPQIGYFISGVTMGQLLSVPMVLFGLYLITHHKRHRGTSAH